MTTGEIKSKLLKVLEDPKYAINSKRLSQSFRDQKEKPLERAVWWIEWVLRNPQPDFLRSPTLQTGHIVGSAFDVVAFVVAMALLALFTVTKVTVFAMGAIRSPKTQALPSQSLKTMKLS